MITLLTAVLLMLQHPGFPFDQELKSSFANDPVSVELIKLETVTPTCIL